MDRNKLVKLIIGVQKGDENAMTEMYNTFFDDIHYYIFKNVKDEELASDLTQDTFIEILQSISSLQEPAAFVTWSRQIAYRRCTAYFKKRHDILVDEDEDGYSIFDTLVEDNSEFIPEEALDKEDLKNTIQNIINELPEEQRSAVMMRYFDELSVADIAKIQEVSEGTVKSRLNYGRKAIKESVENYEKKHGIKLHCIGVVPLLLWLLREHRLANGLSLTTGTASSVGAASVISSAGLVTAATAGAAGTAAATTAVAATKTISGAVIAKIAAGVTAAVIAISTVAYGVASIVKEDTLPEDPPVEDSENISKPCTHIWSEDGSGECTLCDAICDHNDSISSEEYPESEGILRKVNTCTVCNFKEESYSLASTDKPIWITKPVDFISECITEYSHNYMLDLLKDTWKISEDKTVTVTPIGTLYFYNDEVDENSAYNNRLVVIYHLENGIVPGGFYTYLGPNGNVVIKCVTEDDGTEYFSVVRKREFYFDNHLSFLWIEGLKEYYSFMLSTDYPVSFVYNGIRYMGHNTLEDCLKALQINGMDYWGMEYDHMIASGEMREYVSDY
ncbi:MAG: RNA polymerase sigma factor [Ruminococcaceae bacterium]|nr:RNA polymerase sigma factor [Oscillospiraceae bacterium]